MSPQSALLFWTTGAGIAAIPLDAPSQDSDQCPNNIVNTPKVIPYPANNQGSSNAAKALEQGDWLGSILASPESPPLSFAATEFHLLLLYESRLVVLSRITYAPVHVQALSKIKYGNARELVVDTADGSKPTVWLFCEGSVHQILIDDEQHNVWRLYLSMGLFDKSLRHCMGEAQREQVRRHQADLLFDDGEYLEAASLYAQCPSFPFEDVCLHFMKLGEEQGLLHFLKTKLSEVQPYENASGGKMASLSRPTPQGVMLQAWILEIYLHRLQIANDEVFVDIQKDFRTFLLLTHRPESQSIVYGLLESYGQIEELLHYAEHVRDYETVVVYHVNRRKFDMAVQKLSSFDAGDSRDNLIYRFASLLFRGAPSKFIDMITSPAFATLDPVKLLPSLALRPMKSDEATQELGRYLECVLRTWQKGVTLGNSDAVPKGKCAWASATAVYNLLALVYVLTEEDDDMLTRFVASFEGSLHF